MGARRSKQLVLGVFLASLQWSCAAEQPAATIDYELFENTVQLDAATVALLSSASEDLSQLKFVGDSAQLAALQAPNVLLAPPSETFPRGLLRQITAIARDADTTVVTTQPTTVFHAFRRLDVDFQDGLGGEPTSGQLPPIVGPASTIQTLQQSLTQKVSLGYAPLHWVVFDGDKNPATTEDRIEANGSLQITTTFHFWLHFDWETKSVEEAFDALGDVLEDVAGILTGTKTLGALVNLRTGFKIDGDTDVALTIGGKSALHYKKEEPLPPILLPPIVIGPLVFDPSLEFIGTIEGGATGDLAVDFAGHGAVGVGFEYDADVGVPKALIDSPQLTFAEPNATVSAGAYTEATAELRLTLFMYGFVGPYANLTTRATLDVDRQRDPCYELTAALGAGTGASIGVFGHSLASIAGPQLPLADKQLASGSCIPPLQPPPTDAQIDPWSRTYADTVWSVGTSEGWTRMHRVHDGNLVVTAAGSDTVMKVKENGDRVWARKMEGLGDTEKSQWPQHATPMLDASVLVGTKQSTLVKLQADGDRIWAAHLDSANTQEGWVTQVRVGDETWLGGTYRAEINAEGSAWLVVLDAAGNVKRAWTWHTPGYDQTIRHILPLDDGALVVGDGQNFTAADRAFALRVDNDANVVWARQFEYCGGAEELKVYVATETNDGNLVLGGWLESSNNQAILFRIAPDATDTEPAWAWRTSGPILFGPQINSIHQLSTGEYRLVGKYWTTGRDRVFVAGTDSVGRFAWLRTYQGTTAETVGEGNASGLFTQQGGLLVAATTETFEASPGGFWLFEVPLADGAITFSPTSGGVSETLDVTSTEACILYVDAPTSVADSSVSLSAAEVSVSAVTPVTHDQ